MSQNETILNHMRTHKDITSIEAINLYGVTRLAARISELKARGHNIAKEDVQKKNIRYSRYWLEE